MIPPPDDLGGHLIVNVAGACSWTASAADGSGWITLLRDGGCEKIIDPETVYHANLNRTGAPREGRVRFSAGKFAYDLPVRQEVPEEIVSVASVRLDRASGLAPEGGAFRLTAAGTNPRIVVVAGEAWQTGSLIPPSGGR